MDKIEEQLSGTEDDRVNFLAQKIMNCREFQRLVEGMIEPWESAKRLAKQLLDELKKSEVLSEEGLPFLDTDASIKKIYGVK